MASTITIHENVEKKKTFPLQQFEEAFNAYKGNYVLCSKCFKNEIYGENRSMKDFIFKGCPGSNNGEGPVSAEAETLLLWESVFKHGDNWDLIELPFGDFLMRSANEGGDSNSLGLPVNDSLKPVNLSSSENLETQKTENQSRDQSNQSELYGSDEPPSKRQCIAPTILFLVTVAYLQNK
ncbi:hypothetical protein ACFE04_027465 [Oxalis oulophora]